MIDTQGHSSVLLEDPGTTLSRKAAGALVAIFLAIVLAAVMGLVHVPYAILKPGPVIHTLGNGDGDRPLITVNGKGTYPTSGALDFTTVSVFGGPNNPVNVWDWIMGKRDGTNEVVPEEQLFPKGVTSKQVDEENAAEMADSQQAAIAVALRALGQTVPEIVKIRELTKNSPAKGILRAGDIVDSIDGKAVASPDAVRAAIQGHKAGDSAAFVIRRSDVKQTLTVKTGDSKGRAVVGVYLQSAFDFPIKISINAGAVGGPSAGLMFSLGIYDKLTPGAMTGGANIAGTGTIDGTGKVGPIGGIQQKLAGAKRGGADWFLAPASNCDEVVGHIPDGLRVFKIATFTQARDAVEAIAAKQTASLQTCS